MQNGFLAFNDQGMTSVMATLKANHYIGRIRQKIDNLTFAFVAPLGADYDYFFAHVFYLCKRQLVFKQA
jgi:hypothetical protein